MVIADTDAGSAERKRKESTEEHKKLTGTVIEYGQKHESTLSTDGENCRIFKDSKLILNRPSSS